MDKTYAIVPVAMLDQLLEQMERLALRPPPAVYELFELVSNPVEPKLTRDLNFILGRPMYDCMTTAKVLRHQGQNIPERAEDEQAATILWMLNHFLRDPYNWRRNSQEEFSQGTGLLGKTEN